jgi:hypothetical protein
VSAAVDAARVFSFFFFNFFLIENESYCFWSNLVLSLQCEYVVRKLGRLSVNGGYQKCCKTQGVMRSSFSILFSRAAIARPAAAALRHGLFSAPTAPPSLLCCRTSQSLAGQITP